jgi:hypothetical protein
MSNNTDNGNMPAFPQNEEWINEHKLLNQGMTKREYFAAMAMQGMLANPTAGKELQNQSDKLSDACAAASIIMADALISALNHKS